MSTASSRLTRQLVVSLSAAAVLAMAMPEVAQAKRLGGGSSAGRQSSGAGSAMTQKRAEPTAPQQAAPQQPAAAPSAAQKPAQPAAAPQAPSRNRWLGPLAGLAAGIGLAALFSHLGLGAELASFMGSLLMIGLLVLAAVFVYRMVKGGRRGAAPAYAGSQPAQGGDFSAKSSQPAWDASPVQRTADPVTRPAQAPLGSELNAFGQPIASLDAASGFDVQSAEPPLVNIPEGFDTEGFLRSARNVFTRLQAANDSGDLATLKEFASDDLWREFKRDIDARAGAVNHTEVLELNTQLIAYERDFDEHIASVLFAGQIREAAGAPVETFEEIWNLSRPARQGGGWVLVGIQSV